MKAEYDFSNGVRGKFYRAKKIQKTIRLDSDIIEHFQRISTKKKIGYQTLINEALREQMDHPSGLIQKETLRKELRIVFREVLKKELPVELVERSTGAKRRPGSQASQKG